MRSWDRWMKRIRPHLDDRDPLLVKLDQMAENGEPPPMVRYAVVHPDGRAHKGGDTLNLVTPRKKAKLYQSRGAAETARRRCRAAHWYDLGGVYYSHPVWPSTPKVIEHARAAGLLQVSRDDPWEQVERPDWHAARQDAPHPDSVELQVVAMLQIPVLVDDDD